MFSLSSTLLSSSTNAISCVRDVYYTCYVLDRASLLEPGDIADGWNANTLVAFIVAIEVIFAVLWVYASLSHSPILLIFYAILSLISVQETLKRDPKEHESLHLLNVIMVSLSIAFAFIQVHLIEMEQLGIRRTALPLSAVTVASQQGPLAIGFDSNKYKDYNQQQRKDTAILI